MGAKRPESIVLKIYQQNRVNSTNILLGIKFVIQLCLKTESYPTEININV